MKIVLSLFALALASKLVFADYSPQTGDVIFQISQSSQSLAIQAATKSKYSHVGIIILKDKKPYVFEAVQPVKYTKLQDWINRGKNKHYVIKRAKSSLSSEAISTLEKQSKKYEGKNYDLVFGWSDDKIYCSELVWKLYKAADIELAPLSKLGSFDLTHPAVKTKLKERYGNNIPLDEKVVPPSALFDSALLITVDEK